MFYIEQVDSTNKYTKEHIGDISDKTIVYTFNQTAGRGRLCRRWDYVGEDNIYASIVLKPSDKMKDVYANLTQYLCVVLAQTFEEYGVEPKIKWTNDILINSKKISGILAESILEGGLLKGIVLGVGINLNTKKDALKGISQPATSLNIETGKNIDKNEFLKRLLDRFFLRYDEFIAQNFLLIKDEYIRRILFLNQKITIRVFDKEISGFAAGITDEGGLRILTEDNKEQVLLIGDIL